MRKLYDTVLRGQKIGFEKIRAERDDGGRPQGRADNSSSSKATRPDGAMVAWKDFFTAPATDSAWKSTKRRAWARLPPGKLRPGHVVTVEPGLYYPEIGGVRLEDVALVTGNGANNLTRFEKVLEI